MRAFASVSRWREAWIAARNRRFADPRFQRWAADFPLTRRVALARTQALFDLVAGFVYSQTLAACVRLGLFERLQAGPLTTAALAAALDVPPPSMHRLLGAARALGLVESSGGDRWVLGEQGAALLGASGLMQMIAHHERLYADMGDSVALLRRGAGDLAGYWPYAHADEPAAAGGGEVAGYSALMAATQPAVAADLLHAYPFSRHRRLLDVGGGEGAFLQAVAARAPRLELSLFDLPAVAQRARERLTGPRLASRIAISEGDFLRDPLPTGFDLVTLVRILHDHEDAGAIRLLRNVRAALPKDGTLLIGEPMAGDSGRDRVGEVYFAFYLLAMGRGRARSPREMAALLHSAGFTRVRRLRTRTPALLRAMLARP